MSWLPKHCVVVPVDFSEPSLGAVKLSLELAASPESIHIIHVLPEMSPIEPTLLDKDFEKRRTEQAQKWTRNWLDEAGAAIPNVTVLFGSPARAVAQKAKELAADLVIVPSHGRSNIKRLLLGSVAEGIIRHCTCPVLVPHRE